MADQAGTTLRGYGRCPEYSEFFPSDTFDFGRSISNRPRTAEEQVRPRWFGHDLSGAPDSGIGYSGKTGNGRTREDGVGRFGQSTMIVGIIGAKFAGGVTSEGVAYSFGA